MSGKTHVLTINAVNTSMMHCLIFVCLLVTRARSFSLQAHDVHLIGNINLECNFDEFKNGCVDNRGSTCDTNTNKCVCKDGFEIRLAEFCLKRKNLGDSCFASAQCNHIENAGCYNYREEYNHIPSAFFGIIQKNWPSGICRCKVGHDFDEKVNKCVKKTIGSWCHNLWDCRQKIPQSYCESNICQCNPSYFYNQTNDDCHYQEMFGSVCATTEDCLGPHLDCFNGSCKCASTYYFDESKLPNCQPNVSVGNEHRHRLRKVGDGDDRRIDQFDTSFEIFILIAIPLVILFLTIKPCWQKFQSSCKAYPSADEVICGGKEIKIKGAIFQPHSSFCHGHHLQTIEEVASEDLKEGKEKEEIINVTSENDDKQSDNKSIDKIDTTTGLSEDTEVAKESEEEIVVDELKPTSSSSSL